MSEQPIPTGEAPEFEFMVVEIFGHRRHAGRVREEERFGAKMLRIDIPKVERVELPSEDGPVPALATVSWTSHFYGGAAIFSATSTDEATVLRMNAPYAAPSRMSLPAPSDTSDYDDQEPNF
ncbi:hypothetical protein ACLNGM_09855 [Aureimonas phyllosphaerae]|uniref:hypothetical protein n=1 Tax=Aureimonas phyllosphaerae TaxID=1166078 RepID=UPI003A5BAE9B